MFNPKVMLYNNYYWAVTLIWWVILLILLFRIFATPYDVPGQRHKKDSPLDILRKRFASGQITDEEYRVKKKILEHDAGAKS
jgi:putative membrane protein